MELEDEEEKPSSQDEPTTGRSGISIEEPRTSSPFQISHQSDRLQHYLLWMIPPALALIFFAILLSSILDFRGTPVQENEKKSILDHRGSYRRSSSDHPLNEMLVEIVIQHYNATEAQLHCHNMYRTSLVMPRNEREIDVIQRKFFNTRKSHETCLAVHIGLRRILSYDIVSLERNSSSNGEQYSSNPFQLCSALTYSNDSWRAGETSCETTSKCFLCQSKFDCENQDFCLETVFMPQALSFFEAYKVCKEKNRGHLMVIREESDFNQTVGYLSTGSHSAECGEGNSTKILLGNRYQLGFETFDEEPVKDSLFETVSGELWENCAVIERQAHYQIKMAPCEQKLCSACWRPGINVKSRSILP